MTEPPVIDTSFDVRTDARGKDPDSHSATLRRYHQLLWSKPLPNGETFDLVTTRPRAYLYHQSHRGEFFLGSDSVIPSFKSWLVAGPVLDQLDDGEVESFRDLGHTIGGFMVFPGNQIERKWTINTGRGMHRRIADRMDLTLECIRRYYDGDTRTPLGPTIARYDDFFALFGSFAGYVEFFLLQDLVDRETGGVKLFLPSTDFGAGAIPGDVETYREYRDRSVDFIAARNSRIDRWSKEHLPSGSES